MAEDIIGIIANVEDANYQGKTHKKVTLQGGNVLNVKHGREGSLQAKWGILQVGKAIKFTMMDFTKPDGSKAPFVSDIATIEGELPPTGVEQPVRAKPQGSTNESIESQVAFKGIIELMVAKIIDKEDTEGKTALIWAMARLNPFPPNPSPEATKSIKQPVEEKVDSSPHKNIGALLNNAIKLAKENGVTFVPSELCEAIGVETTQEIADLKSAWQDVMTIINKKVEGKG